MRVGKGGGQGNRVLDSDYRWQTSARHKSCRPELDEGAEILHASPVSGPLVGLWDGVWILHSVQNDNLNIMRLPWGDGPDTHFGP